MISFLPLMLKHVFKREQNSSLSIRSLIKNKSLSIKSINFNCVSPGGIFDNQPRKFVERYKKDCLSKGLLDAKDILGSIIFLLSDSSKFINGQNIIIDDGWSL